MLKIPQQRKTSALAISSRNSSDAMNWLTFLQHVASALATAVISVSDVQPTLTQRLMFYNYSYCENTGWFDFNKCYVKTVEGTSLFKKTGINYLQAVTGMKLMKVTVLYAAS